MKIVIIIALLIFITLGVAGTDNIQQSPVLVTAVFPDYPPIAMAANASGDVKLRATINAQGDVMLLLESPEKPQDVVSWGEVKIMAG